MKENGNVTSRKKLKNLCEEQWNSEEAEASVSKQNERNPHNSRVRIMSL